MSSIRITTLGGLRIERDGDEIHDLPAQPVRCALFLYLALERGATRDELAALLWPERDADRARHSLSQTLYELRRQLGEAWIESRGERVDVRPAVTVDALDFLAEAEAGRDEEALARYGGAFLAGCHLGATAEFESWMDRRRAQLARLHRDLCRRLTAARTEVGNTEGALAVARRWAEMDPLDDEAHHQIIELLAGSGRRAEALRHYEEYQELIRRELEVEPLEETQALVARIREAAPPSLPGASQLAAPVRAEAGIAAADRSAIVVDREATGAARHGARRSRYPLLPGRREHWVLGALAALLIAAGFLLWGSVGDARHADRDAAVSDADTALDPRGVAVLPFLNLSLDPEQEYFSDGITEDLLTNLSRIDGLRVISRTSSWQYKGVARPMARVARELGVAYVVEGSVRRDGEQLRITAQLIDAATDTHLWAETYDRELGGIFQIQSEIAQRIAEQLRQRLSPADRERIAAGGTGNPTAYDLLLRGREYLNRPGPADVRKYGPAMSFFRQALELDPGYARAYVGLSEAYRNHVALPLPMRRDSVLAFARKAVELDPESAEAAAALGWASLLARDWPAAEQAFRRALEREPNQVAALSGRARLAWLNGRLDDAVRWQRRAVAVDPASGQQLTTLGGFLLDLGDLAGARAAYRRAVELAPDAPVSSFMLAQIHLIQGEEEEAEERMRALAAASSDHPGTQFLLGRFYAQRGRFAEAQAPLARAAEALAGGATGTVALQQAYVAQRLGESERAAVLLRRAEVDLATHERDGTYAARLLLQLHALRGERERAVELLRWQWEQGSGAGVLDGPQLGLYWLDRDPLLEELRSDPAFQHHLRRIRAERDSMRLLPDR